MTGLMQTLGQDVVLFALAASVLFILGYTLLAKWWKSEICWARVSLDFGIAVALSPTFLHVAFGLHIDHSAAFGWYAIGAVFFVGLVSLWNLALVARSQITGRWRQSDGATPHRNARAKGRRTPW